MKKYFLFQIFKSHYCKIVFIVALIATYFIVPKKIFFGYYTLLGIGFIVTTAFTLTCLVRVIKEKIFSAKASGASLVGILSMVFGLGALQACTIGAPLCGATISSGILALLFPNFAFPFFEKYSVWIVVGSIALQLFALYSMNCFKAVLR